MEIWIVFSSKVFTQTYLFSNFENYSIVILISLFCEKKQNLFYTREDVYATSNECVFDRRIMIIIVATYLSSGYKNQKKTIM
jgi:hypothetical protein